MRVDARLFVRVEERDQRVEIFRRDRIELVIVATCAADREAEERGACRVHAIGRILKEVLLVDRAAFIGGHVRAIETARDDLISRCVWNQVTRELLDDELIVGLVFAEGLDHPIAPEPHLATRIHVNARRVGVARDVEPRHGEALRSARCVRLFGKEAIHKPFVAVRARVGDVGVGFARRWR